MPIGAKKNLGNHILIIAPETQSPAAKEIKSKKKDKT